MASAQCHLTDFGERCSRPAAASYQAACVHEHVMAGAACAGHVPLNGEWFCTQCRDGASPHRCPVGIVIAEDLTAVSRG